MSSSANPKFMASVRSDESRRPALVPATRAPIPRAYTDLEWEPHPLAASSGGG